MPLFEYQCKECNAKFEELVSFSQSNEMTCPKCGSKNTQKLVSAFATIGGSSSERSAANTCVPGSSRFT